MGLTESQSSLAEHGAVLAAVVLIAVGLSLVLHRYRSGSPPFRDVLRGTRNLILPFGTGWYLLTRFDAVQSSVWSKVAQTLFWVSVIWVGTGVIKLVFFARAGESTWRARVPGLFVNLVQVSLILVGAAMVIAGVWNQNLGALLATLGVGSLVVGLALQDTLGNLFSGISLLFERPFATGDWIGIGHLHGRVTHINWRAVHIVTREKDLHVVPNLVLGKEVINNYSRPNKAHGVFLEVGFSYDDPPNKCKRMLREICEDVPEILPYGISVRTLGYQDFLINYQIRFFIEDYLRQPEIEDDFMSRVWYAARRKGITIPFPIRTVHNFALQQRPVVDRPAEIRAALKRVPLFDDLGAEELVTLGDRASILDFAAGDAIVRQNDPGDSMYVIERGTVTVKHQVGTRASQALAELSEGACFGEMSLLTGEPRSATVVAKTDTLAILIQKSALSAILEARPELAQTFAQVVEERRRGQADLIEHEPDVPDEQSRDMSLIGIALVNRIRSFFSLRGDGDDPDLG